MYFQKSFLTFLNLLPPPPPLLQAKDGNYGDGQTCSGAGMTYVANNTVYSPTGAITECGKTLAQWQAAGNDPNTVALPYPADSVILDAARRILGL